MLTPHGSGFAGPWRIEAKTIAEYALYKICSLLLITMPSSQTDDNRNEAIRQFRAHVRSYKADAMPTEVEFEHWAWVRLSACVVPAVRSPSNSSMLTPPDRGWCRQVVRQYRMFGELLEKSGANSDSNDRWQWPGLYFHAAAKYTMKQRQTAKALCPPELVEHQLHVPPSSKPNRCGWPSAVLAIRCALSFRLGQVVLQQDRGGGRLTLFTPTARYEWTSTFYGQFLDNQVGIEHEVYKQLIVAEAGFSHTEFLLEMLNRAYKRFKQRNCKRTMYLVVSEMAEEYFACGEFDKARRLYESVSTQYRTEQWWSVLATTLQRLSDCAISLGACLGPGGAPCLCRDSNSNLLTPPGPAGIVCRARPEFRRGRPGADGDVGDPEPRERAAGRPSAGATRLRARAAASRCRKLGWHASAAIPTREC